MSTKMGKQDINVDCPDNSSFIPLDRLTPEWFRENLNVTSFVIATQTAITKEQHNVGKFDEGSEHPALDRSNAA